MTTEVLFCLFWSLTTSGVQNSISVSVKHEVAFYFQANYSFNFVFDPSVSVKVVQQIDVLTSNIDLDEEETSPSNGLSQDATKSSQTDVVALIHYSNGEEDTTYDSSLAHSPVDLVHNNSHSPMRNHTSLSPPEKRSITVEDKGKRVVKQTSETQRMLNGNCLPHRTARKGQLENHRPPIVPVVCTNSNKTHRPPPYPQNGQVKMRTPPYPGKHKMLSSTIV